MHSLPCSEETQTILAGYIVQGEFGDYDVADHTPGYLDDYPFVMGKVSCNLGWAEAQLVCACVCAWMHVCVPVHMLHVCT